MSNQTDALGYYAVLNVPSGADISLIKQRYHDQAKDLHPDHNASADAVDTFQKLSVAYEILSTPLKRAQYDMLSFIYTEKDFPQIGSLKIYKNQSNKDDKALRVLKQRTVKASFKETVVRESKDICNIQEAGNMVLNTSFHNWLKGWWGKGAFRKNIAAIRFNLASTSVQDTDNLKLLIHNAAAYAQENNPEMAWVYAQQAKTLWRHHEHVSMLMDNFLSVLDYHPDRQTVIPYWNAAELRRRQFLFPIFLGFILVLATLGYLYHAGILVKKQTESYYYADGLGADMLESKIIKTDSDITSTEHLVHFNKDTTIYNGPDARYAPLSSAKQNQTVRIIGYTPNKAWYQVVIDNGERGYVQQGDIEQGIGDEVPFNSRVYHK